jgi:hypothetical protein
MQINRSALSAIAVLAFLGFSCQAQAQNNGSNSSTAGYLTGIPTILAAQTVPNSSSSQVSGNGIAGGTRVAGTTGGSSNGNTGFALPNWLSPAYLTPMKASPSGSTQFGGGGGNTTAAASCLHDIDQRDWKIAKPWSHDELNEEVSFAQGWNQRSMSWNMQTLSVPGKEDNPDATATDINSNPQWKQYPPNSSPLSMLMRPWLTESTDGTGGDPDDDSGSEMKWYNRPPIPGVDYGEDKGAVAWPPFMQPIACGPITKKIMEEVPPLQDVPSSNVEEIRNQVIGNYLGTSVKMAPRSIVDMALAEQQAKAQLASDATGAASQQAFANLESTWMSPLPNVANENAASPLTQGPIRQVSQAIWVVQQMYKQVFLPMALLLLLPGAILTQAKGLVSNGLIHNSDDEDSVSPFTGILRAVIAIFLIPATQLIISYAIDAGNALSYAVQTQMAPNMGQLKSWADEQLFSVPQSNAMNELIPPQVMTEQPNPALESEQNPPVGAIAEDLGKTSDAPSEQSQLEQQTDTTVSLEFMYNMLNMFLNMGLLVLCACQLVIMCYLFLLGPIAAAFFVWPSGFGGMFHKTFANWIDAVINLCLWRFWWCVITLCMETRMSWLQQTTGFQINTQWEMIMFTAFMVMMMYVPFLPWSFKPGEMVTEIMQKASQMKEASGVELGGGAGSMDSSSSQTSGSSGTDLGSSQASVPASSQSDFAMAPVGSGSGGSGGDDSWRFGSDFDDSKHDYKESGIWSTVSTSASVV